MQMALVLAAMASASAAAITRESRLAPALALRGGGGPSMPQTVLAATGSVLSLSGVATLIE